MDKVILGDNQFFGVNHLSGERARQQMKKFKDIRNCFECSGLCE